MADEKLSAVTPITVLVGTDLLYVVSDPGGTPLSRSITKDDFTKYPDGTVIFDSNGLEVLKIVKIASAVNEVTIKNAIATGQPEITATGDDAAIDLLLSGKSTGVPKVTSMKIVTILDTNGNELVKFTTTASAVNEFEIVNSATLTALQLKASGGDTNIDIQVVPKGIGVFFGHRETYGFALSDDDTAPLTIGVKQTSVIAPYDFNIDDVIISLKTTGAGAALVEVDILRETAVNSNTFETIFTTRPTIDAAEYTSASAATPPVISTSLDDVLKGERIQLKIETVDTDLLATGLKCVIAGHALAA